MVITRVDHVAIKTSASAGSSIYISHYPCNCRINIHFHPGHVTSSLSVCLAHIALALRYSHTLINLYGDLIPQFSSSINLTLHFIPWLENKLALLACQPRLDPRPRLFVRRVRFANMQSSAFGLTLMLTYLYFPQVFIKRHSWQSQIGIRFVSKTVRRRGKY